MKGKIQYSVCFETYARPCSLVHHIIYSFAKVYIFFEIQSINSSKASIFGLKAEADGTNRRLRSN